MAWYVLRCPSGKEIDLQQRVQKRFGTECFIPIEKVRQRDRHGRFVWVQRCALSSYLFVNTDKDTFYSMYKDSYMLYPMRHKVDDLWTPIIVPDRDMESFIRVSGNKEERVLYLDPAKLNFKKGDRVRVIGGSLTGVEGTFMQIGGKHEKRVVIQLDNIVAVASAAIPATLVERI